MMEITDIKNIVLSALKNFFNPDRMRARIKEALKLPYAKTYVLLSFVFTMLFLIVTFPYDVLLQNYLKNLEKSVLRTIHISEMKVGLFNVMMLSNAYIVFPGGSELSIRAAEMDLSMLRLIFSKDIKGSFKFEGLKYNADNTKIDLNLNGEVFIDFDSFKNPPQGGNFKIMIENAVVRIEDITLPDSMGGLPLSLPYVKIKSGKIDGTISNQKINITSIKLFGDLNCTINGSIALAKTFLSSRIDLKVTADANSEALKNFKDFLGKNINDRNELVLSVRGFLAKPYIDLGQSGADTPPTRMNSPAHRMPPGMIPPPADRIPPRR